MVTEIQQDPSLDGKPVVICRQHEVMTDIAEAFGVDEPPQYPKGRYDRAWLIDLTKGHRATFRDPPERLLEGDSWN